MIAESYLNRRDPVRCQHEDQAMRRSRANPCLENFAIVRNVRRPRLT